MNEETISKIESFLYFDQNEKQDFKVLYRYSILPSKFTSVFLKAFYSLHSNTFVTFENQKVNVTEIMYNCDGFLNQISDDLCVLILCNIFINRNQLDLEHIISDEHFKIFCSKENWIKNQELVFVLPNTKRIVRLIENGVLPLFLVEISMVPVKINNDTLEYLINKDINIPELMTCKGLNDNSIDLISDQIIKNQLFKKKCEIFIEDQGILNPTMQIIASLLNISKKSLITDFSHLHSKYCGTHFDNIYIPFNQFKSIGNISNPREYLSRLEVYYVYLYHKKSIKDDLEQISIALTSREESIDCKLKYNENIELSLTPLNDGFKSETVNRSVSAQILDLVFKNNFLIDFEPYSFQNIHELACEPYFERIIKVYARNILVNKIHVPMNAYLTDASIILNFLQNSEIEVSENYSKRPKVEMDHDNKFSLISSTTQPTVNNISLCKLRPCNPKNLINSDSKEIYTQPNEIECSLDLFPTSILFSSLDFKESQNYCSISCSLPEFKVHNCRIPLVDFSTCSWLSENEKNLILSRYVDLYNINQIVSNILQVENSSQKVSEFVNQNFCKIFNKTDKLKIQCKFEISIDSSQYNEREIKEVLNEVTNLYSLRTFIMTNKVPKKIITKLFDNLSDSKLEHLIEETLVSSASDDFIVVLVETISKKYEFSHLFNHLIYYLNLKRPIITKYIQLYFIDLLKSMYIDESYIPLFQKLYEKFLNYEDSQIKANNDKILILIARCASAMDKETYYGNIKQNQ